MLTYAKSREVKTELPTQNEKVINHTEAGNRVRALRERTDISLRKFAKLMDVSAPFMSDLERGRRNWTQEKYERAVKILTK